MLYKPTEQEQENQADKELALKLSLEPAFSKEIEDYLHDVASTAFIVFSRTGYVITGEGFHKRLESLLDSHYKEVQDHFGMQTTPLFDNDDDELAALLIAFAAKRGLTRDMAIAEIERINRELLDRFRIENVPIRAKMISATTDKELEAAFYNARLDAEPTATNEDIAKTGSEGFKRTAKPRADIVSTTETQFSAEGAKLADMDALAIISASALAARKTWRSRGDGRVRPAHVAANGQKIHVDKPFEVGGERLMYPADTSLGASAGNIINCRCSAIYSVL